MNNSCLNDIKILRKVIGDNVKNYRQRVGLSQVELTNAIGKSFFTISSIERGIHNTTVSTLVRIANTLNVPYVSFLKTEDNIVIRKSKMIAALAEKK